jgi:hypothetical protein
VLQESKMNSTAAGDALGAMVDALLLLRSCVAQTVMMLYLTP